MSAATDFARLQRLPPQEAIAYMQGRELVGETFSAYDLWQDQHGRAFTISRLARADLLEALQKSLAQSVAGDLNRKDWIDNAEKLLKNAGWWGSKEVTDPRTGELLKTRFNHARLQLIFDTNVRQAQAAGQWQRLLRNRRIHPYARYVCMDDDRVRPLHRSWHNVTLPLDDPWWQTHRPPNGYRCRCRIIGVSQRDYDRGEVLSRPGAETDENAPIVRQPMRKTAPQDGFTNWTNPSTGEVKRIPAGIDPGFDYNAGTVGESQAFKALIERKLAALGPGVRATAIRAGLHPPKPVQSVPPSASPTPDPAPWRKNNPSEGETRWHDAAFFQSPQWMKDAVGRRGALAGGVVQVKGSAHYNRSTDQINMQTLQSTDLKGQGIWRHEYGHAMDAKLGNGMRLRSSEPDFAQAMQQDASDLITLGGHGPKNYKATKEATARLQAAYASSETALLQASDRTQWLTQRYAQSGMDFGQVQVAMRQHTVFAVELQGVGLDSRYARIITANEQRDAQGLMDAMTGGCRTAEGARESSKTYNKGSIGNLSDLFGSATKNKVSGFSKSGYGHSDSYYKYRGASETECFANMTGFYGDANPPWRQMIDTMTPHMAHLFKEIIQ